MKTFTIASIVALASVATAQLSAIPSCALTCLAGPLGSDGCSGLTDFACHCKKGAALLAQVQPCVSSACSASDQAATVTAIQNQCQSVGVPLSLSVSAAASSAAPSSAAPASSASAVVSSAASAASSAQASASSAASAAASSAAAAASSVVASAKSSLSSVLATATASKNSTVSATASPITGSPSAGAAQATKAAGLIGAAALAMLAF